MLAREVADLLRGFMEEDDQTFITDTQVAVFLARGYARFRDLVCRYDPHQYRAAVTLTLSNQDSYDLESGAVKILGAGILTATRLSRLLRVSVIDTAGNWVSDLIGAADWTELKLVTDAYLLQGTVLNFTMKRSDRLQVVYVPVSAVDWTKIGPADTESIDDLDEFHDLIACYAYPYYAVRDGADSPQVKALQAERERDLATYLGYGRSPGSSDHAGWRA